MNSEIWNTVTKKLSQSFLSNTKQYEIKYTMYEKISGSKGSGKSVMQLYKRTSCIQCPIISLTCSSRLNLIEVRLSTTLALKDFLIRANRLTKNYFPLLIPYTSYAFEKKRIKVHHE